MGLTLDALAVLDAIERRGSFAAAAAELGRVPSAITYTVQKLEQELGVELFDRSRHRARLTPAGQRLLQDGRHLLQAARSLEETVRSVATGWEVRLTLAVGHLLPQDCLYPLLQDFYRRRFITRLSLSREAWNGVWDALSRSRADLVVGACGDDPTKHGYASHVLGRMPLLLTMSPRHPLACVPEPIPETLLHEHRLVSVADSAGGDAVPTDLAPFLNDARDSLLVPDTDSQIQAQAQGLGVGFLPHYRAREEARAGRLVCRTLRNGPPTVRLCLAWRNGGQGNALRWFIRRLLNPGLFDGLLQPD